MKQARCRSILSLLLVFSMLVVGGLASAQSITHESHHAHHQKATHGTVLCSWICAAGQVFEAAAVVIQSDRNPIGVASQPVVSEPTSAVHRTASSRGPPFLSV